MANNGIPKPSLRRFRSLCGLCRAIQFFNLRDVRRFSTSSLEVVEQDAVAYAGVVGAVRYLEGHDLAVCGDDRV